MTKKKELEIPVVESTRGAGYVSTQRMYQGIDCACDMRPVTIAELQVEVLIEMRKVKRRNETVEVKR